VQYIWLLSCRSLYTHTYTHTYTRTKHIYLHTTHKTWNTYIAQTHIHILTQTLSQEHDTHTSQRNTHLPRTNICPNTYTHITNTDIHIDNYDLSYNNTQTKITHIPAMQQHLHRHKYDTYNWPLKSYGFGGADFVLVEFVFETIRKWRIIKKS